MHPTARPGDLGSRLQARGIVEAEVVPGMVADLDEIPSAEPVPDGIELVEVRPGDYDAFIELVAWRYALPADAGATLDSIMRRGRVGGRGSLNRGWLARHRGAAVSKVMLHLGAGVAGIYGVATKTEARGRGLARLLTLHALQAARAAGMDTGVLHSTPMAVGLYEALGFRRIADFGLYTKPGIWHL